MASAALDSDGERTPPLLVEVARYRGVVRSDQNLGPSEGGKEGQQSQPDRFHLQEIYVQTLL